MQLSSESIKSIEHLCGSGEFEEMPEIRSLPPFDERVCDFLGELSSVIMKNHGAKAFPDVVTFGFFCRRANINKLRQEYEGRIKNRLGKGVTFHIAPSNVPINFAYSLVCALLAGNCSVVRASSKPFPQVDVLCGCINSVLEREEFSHLGKYINTVRYPHNDEINAFFSSICDVRIIWGGDSTIEGIRKFPLPPRSSDITFADRYSAAVIDAKAVLKAKSLEGTARDFYNDTYLYDQNACSSPRLIFWLGTEEECAAGSDKFFDAVHSFIKGKYDLAPVVAMDKYCTAMRAAIDLEADIVPSEDNLISRIRVKKISKELYDYRCAGGSFIEYFSRDLEDLPAVIGRKVQTLSYYGVDSALLSELIVNNGLNGTDRIVPMGKTADFSLEWDGYDLIMQLSRLISVS